MNTLAKEPKGPFYQTASTEAFCKSWNGLAAAGKAATVVLYGRAHEDLIGIAVSKNGAVAYATIFPGKLTEDLPGVTIQPERVKDIPSNDYVELRFIDVPCGIRIESLRHTNFCPAQEAKDTAEHIKKLYSRVKALQPSTSGVIDDRGEPVCTAVTFSNLKKALSHMTAAGNSDARISRNPDSTDLVKISLVRTETPKAADGAYLLVLENEYAQTICFPVVPQNFLNVCEYRRGVLAADLKADMPSEKENET